MPCTVCGAAGHNRGTCPKALGGGIRKPTAKREAAIPEYVNVPRGFRPVRLPDGQIVLMKHEHLYPEKVQCECGVQVSAADKRALLRHQKTKGHLDWASKMCAYSAWPKKACSTPEAARRAVVACAQVRADAGPAQHPTQHGSQDHHVFR